jgi:hypothetical protein
MSNTRPGSSEGSADDHVAIEDFACDLGIDPDTVPALHTHYNPETGQVATASWPCPQCLALGRTEPLRYGRDFPDEGGAGPVTEIPADRLDAYLASFGPPPRASAAPPGAGGHRARRRARRQAERKNKRRRQP